MKKIIKQNMLNVLRKRKKIREKERRTIRVISKRST